MTFICFSSFLLSNFTVLLSTYLSLFHYFLNQEFIHYAYLVFFSYYVSFSQLSILCFFGVQIPPLFIDFICPTFFTLNMPSATTTIYYTAVLFCGYFSFESLKLEFYSQFSFILSITKFGSS